MGKVSNFPKKEYLSKEETEKIKLNDFSTVTTIAVAIREVLNNAIIVPSDKNPETKQKLNKYLLYLEAVWQLKYDIIGEDIFQKCRKKMSLVIDEQKKHKQY